MILKSILAFSDFKKFLKHYYDFCKREDNHFTYALFSKKAGIKSTNFLKLVIDGKRSLTHENIMKIARTLSMSFEETRYFENLVLYQQSNNSQDKKYYSKKIKLLKEKTVQGLGKTKKNQLFEKSYYPLLLLYLHEKKIDRDYGPITKLLNIKNINDEIKTLLSLKLLLIEKKRYILSDPCLIFDDQSGLNINVKNYFQNCLHTSQTKLTKEFSNPDHFFLSQYFRINKKFFREYTDLLLKCIEEISNDSDHHKGDDYFLLNIQMLKLFNTK